MLRFKSCSLKEDRVLEVDNAFARQGWTGGNWSLIIEEKMRVHELKFWESRTSQMFEPATSLEVGSRHKPFLIEVKSLLNSVGKMIGEQYKINGIAQAETIRIKRDLRTFIDRGLRIKKQS